MGLQFAPIGLDNHDLKDAGHFDREQINWLLMPQEAGDDYPMLMTLPGGNDIARSHPFFHIDSKGASCFTLDEARAASQVVSHFILLLRDNLVCTYRERDAVYKTEW